MHFSLAAYQNFLVILTHTHTHTHTHTRPSIPSDLLHLGNSDGSVWFRSHWAEWLHKKTHR
jgi:hypothetical protein